MGNLQPTALEEHDGETGGPTQKNFPPNGRVLPGNKPFLHHRRERWPTTWGSEAEAE